jgi:hypothetical protein
MATVFEDSEEKFLLCVFVGKRTPMQSTFIIKCFLFTVGSVCRVKRFHLGDKRFADDNKVETKVQEWLIQQSKDFYAAGFDAPVKRWDKCIDGGRGYVEK